MASGRAAARTSLAERKADLLPEGYFHVVFTLPAEVADIAFQNKAAVYDLPFRAASETMLTIAANPKHLGARTGITAALLTWGSAMTHHPHVHMIVPGGGLSRSTHRVAISNRRLIGFDDTSVTFRYKDYRRSGPERQQVMRLETGEFIRRFLLHVLPRGFLRTRHYGLLASATRKANIVRARELLAVAHPSNPGAAASRPIRVYPVRAAAAACASSRPSNAGCSRACRLARLQRPERHRDPARPDPEQRRNHSVPTIDPTRVACSPRC